MAKIKNSHPKDSSGGYERVFDNREIGYLIQRIQSAVISNGNELENLIVERSKRIDDLDSFIDSCLDGTIESGSYLCRKSVIKKSKYKLDKHEPDFIVFEIKALAGNCYIIELKDGNNFDTKKSDGEYASLKDYQTHLGAKVPFITNFYICCFNQLEKDVIVKGFKNRFAENQVMTGEELCRLLGFEYQEILNQRKEDAEDNKVYFVSELLKIPAFVELLQSEYRQHIDETAFYDEEEE